jgi:UTP:GlnB (protein PII) uridylyltransferase
LDNDAHPTHSIVTVRGSDRPGLVRDITAAFAKQKINVHHARISTTNEVVADRFEVSTRHGQKINAALLDKAVSLLS